LKHHAWKLPPVNLNDAVVASGREQLDLIRHWLHRVADTFHQPTSHSPSSNVRFRPKAVIRNVSIGQLKLTVDAHPNDVPSARTGP
jgi:hypothetical protein